MRGAGDLIHFQPCPASKPCLTQAAGQPRSPGSQDSHPLQLLLEEVPQGLVRLLSLDPVQGPDLKGIATFLKNKHVL